MKKLKKSDLTVFNQILCTDIELLAKDEAQTRDIELAFLICKRPWQIAINLFIQENWSSRYGIKITKNEKTIYQPYLNLVTSMYELIKEITTLNSYHNIYFSDTFPSDINTIAWLARCIVDFTALNFYELAYSDLPKIYNNNKKEAIIEIERNRLRILKSHKNPFDKKYLGIHNLVNASLQLINTFDQYEKKYWEPFLKTYTQIPKFLKSSNVAIARIKSGHVTIQKGQGRPPKVLLTKP